MKRREKRDSSLGKIHRRKIKETMAVWESEGQNILLNSEVNFNEFSCFYFLSIEHTDHLSI